jgi:hypothetical protein
MILKIIALSSSETTQNLSEEALLQTMMICVNEHSVSKSRIVLESMYNQILIAGGQNLPI